MMPESWVVKIAMGPQNQVGLLSVVSRIIMIIVRRLLQ